MKGSKRGDRRCRVHVESGYVLDVGYWIVSCILRDMHFEAKLMIGRHSAALVEGVRNAFLWAVLEMHRCLTDSNGDGVS